MADIGHHERPVGSHKIVVFEVRSDIHIGLRTTRFAEAEVEWHGERWLVAMPLNPSAMPRIERTVSALRKLNTGYLAECRILPGEMRWHDATGTERHTDLVLQHLPAGREFAEALLAEDKATLLAALDTLQAALGELEFTHNNLKETNLRWHRGRFVPIRYYDARIGAAEPGTADREAFDVLRHRIAEAPVPRQTANDVTVPYNPLRSLTERRILITFSLIAIIRFDNLVLGVSVYVPKSGR